MKEYREEKTIELRVGGEATVELGYFGLILVERIEIVGEHLEIHPKITENIRVRALSNGVNSLFERNYEGHPVPEMHRAMEEKRIRVYKEGLTWEEACDLVAKKKPVLPPGIALRLDIAALCEPVPRTLTITLIGKHPEEGEIPEPLRETERKFVQDALDIRPMEEIVTQLHEQRTREDAALLVLQDFLEGIEDLQEQRESVRTLIQVSRLYLGNGLRQCSHARALDREQAVFLD